MADVPDLQQLRHQLDDLDRELIDVLARRLAVCREVAALKEHSDTPVIQPARVRDVLTSRRAMAIDAGVDADFAEQVVRVLLTETHRIEVAGNRPDPAPDKLADASAGASALDTVASRIDHVVVAVDDVDATAATLRARFGFHVEQFADGQVPGMVAVAAGGVTLVLVGPAASPAVAGYLAQHGAGIQHLSIEVLNAGYARASLAESGAPLLTDVVIDGPGHEQFFAARDPRSGLQFGFISRTGHRVGVGAANVLALFDTLADPSPDVAAG
jgi:chorismate mutase/catechol 2,3-dioxygenase-like lactoylglutathione lyase family enzyme